MRAAATKLTVYFSERERAGARFLADSLLDLYDSHAVKTSVLLRGADGFGVHHRLHTDRLLTSSENLPAVSIAVDTTERMSTTLAEVRRLTAGRGLITVERAELISGEDLGRIRPPGDPSTLVKLTLYGGRSVRSDGAPGYAAAVDRLAAAGAAGASVLLAVDGTLHGERRRARFLARNADVPLMLIAFIRGGDLAGSLPSLAGLLDDPVATIERVQLCKADGAAFSTPLDAAVAENHRQKITVHVEEGATHAGRPVHSELLLALRQAGATGATTLRGVRGFYGQREPFADRTLSLRRNVPVLLVMIETPDRLPDLWPTIDELTAEHGLVTNELVPVSFTAQ